MAIPIRGAKLLLRSRVHASNPSVSRHCVGPITPNVGNGAAFLPTVVDKVAVPTSDSTQPNAHVIFSSDHHMVPP